jgi:peptide chain release factor 2
MLLKMYQRYAERRGFTFTLLNVSYGEQKGIKSAACELSGSGVYDELKEEAGVHRLVRISPFSAKSLRHTSFALIDILPEVKEAELKIDPDDLRIDTFRSSGPGGQHLQKTDSAVRITHIPTNITTSIQSERSQAQNKEKAMQILTSKLTKLMAEKRVEEISELKAKVEPGGIEWGSQIRSYVLHPYKMVKDHRTGVKSSQPEEVLDGKLGKFIKAQNND